MNSFIALLQRELWEHTSLLKVPAGLLLLFFLANLAVILWGTESNVYITIQDQSTQITNLVEAFNSQQHDVVEKISDAVKGIMLAIGVVIHSVLQILIIFYVLEALFKERKDRSILFWKSLPLSDTEVVVSKLVIALVVVPVISFVTIMIGQLLTLVMQGFMLREITDALSILWQHAKLPHLWNGYFFLRVEQSLWFFPVIGWMLFCSAWARKSPFALAILLPMLLIFIDSAFRLHTGISEMLLERSPIVVPAVSSVMIGFEMADTTDVDSLTALIDRFVMQGFNELFGFLINIKVLSGILVGMLFTLAAIWTRRRQGEGW